jgi:hypothetical protein
VGDLGKGFAYKAYLMTSLDSPGFSADEDFVADGRMASPEMHNTWPLSDG